VISAQLEFKYRVPQAGLAVYCEAEVVGCAVEFLEICQTVHQSLDGSLLTTFSDLGHIATCGHYEGSRKTLS